MNPGDFVKLRLAREEIECTLLESSDSNVVLVKLKSGYNIGIPKDHVYDSVVLKSAQTSSKSSVPVKREGLPSIGLIVTGGTIASKLDPKTGAVSPLTDVNEFSKFYPDLFSRVNVKKIDVPFMKLSENMTSDDWIVLAEHVKKFLDDPTIQGVIITHGTDTLHYTSAALSFFLNVTKPVVLTYAQRSIDRGSSDAKLNLLCAAQMALSECAEVMLVGHADMQDDFCFALRGTKVRKMHTSRRDAFKPINCEPIAKVWPDKITYVSSFNARKNEASEIDAVFNDKIALLTFYPGQNSDVIDYYRMHGYKGLVIQVAGIGNLPAGDAAHSWTSAIKKAIREGMVICGAAQTIYGRLSPKVYSTGRELEKAGVIFLEDMTSETAFVKLGWVLGHRHWRTAEKVREKMLENIRGEFNTLLTE